MVLLSSLTRLDFVVWSDGSRVSGGPGGGSFCGGGLVPGDIGGSTVSLAERTPAVVQIVLIWRKPVLILNPQVYVGRQNHEVQVFLGWSHDLKALPGICRASVQQFGPSHTVFSRNADLPVSIDDKLGASVLQGQVVLAVVGDFDVCGSSWDHGHFVVSKRSTCLQCVALIHTLVVQTGGVLSTTHHTGIFLLLRTQNGVTTWFQTPSVDTNGSRLFITRCSIQNATKVVVEVVTQSQTAELTGV